MMLYCTKEQPEPSSQFKNGFKVRRCIKPVHTTSDLIDSRSSCFWLPSKFKIRLNPRCNFLFLKSPGRELHFQSLLPPLLLSTYCRSCIKAFISYIKPASLSLALVRTSPAQDPHRQIALTAPDVPELPAEHNIPLFLSRRQGANFGHKQC